MLFWCDHLLLPCREELASHEGNVAEQAAASHHHLQHVSRHLQVILLNGWPSSKADYAYLQVPKHGLVA